ncbi:SpoIIE family protein phosphatase [Aquimonas voraii]|uniref:Histidine kinase-like ATPase domain-containing protein n=1 Tax=Aquimonas voraii TaxID=265719 RepID=A0A1G6T6V7_9GAMM|nr:SpoIIE family protein phosphatase [Aquimonas voraii]SDD24703.1 Histidine kinase-like ATPase domain-containing protein [Aquimonas voraii]
MQIPFPEGDDNLTANASAEAPEASPRHASLQRILTRALAAFGLLPLLLLGLIAGAGDYLVRLHQAKTSLGAAVTAASADLDLFLVAHRSAVQQLAAEFARSPGDESDLVERLRRTREAFPGFLTMLATDAEGLVIAGSFDNRTGIDRTIWHRADVSDRAYFQQPRRTRTSLVTGVFQGRGFGDDALCAVSAPIQSADGGFAGVVQGSIRLLDLSAAFAAASHSEGLGLVILDPEGRVAWASPGLGLKPLEAAPEGLSRDLPLSLPSFQRPDIPGLPDGDVLLLEQPTGLGWRVLALLPRQVLLERTLLDLTVVLLSLLAMAGLALVAGRRFVLRFLRPLEDIALRMDRLSLSSHPERFRHRSDLSELARLEGAFLRLGQRLGDSYQQLQEEFAKESALRAELAEARAEALRAEGELDAAREIQMAMLPSRSRLQGWPGLRLAALLEPMRAVGGDFFNVLPLDSERVAFFIGDVSDKGVPAALFMARTMTLLEPGAGRGESPSETLQRVGRVLAQDNPNGMFVTVLIGRMDLDSGLLVLASAGHDPPLLRTGDGRVQRVELDTGPALGFEEEAEYPQVQLRLRPGDALLMFTDGLSEAEDARGTAFGEARIAEVMAAVPEIAPQRLVDALTAAVQQHRQASPADDLTLLCLQRPLDAEVHCGEVGLLPSLGVAALPDLLLELEAELAGRGLDAETLHDVRLVAEEIVSNALTHGCHSTFGVGARVGFELLPERVRLRFEDDGSPFDPLAQNLPDVDIPIEERGIGGLGVLLVRELARDAHYERRDGLNRLILWLPRHAPRAAPSTPEPRETGRPT